jgi:hypothetical protein
MNPGKQFVGSDRAGEETGKPGWKTRDRRDIHQFPFGEKLGDIPSVFSFPLNRKQRD